jgi:hypothetical protein
MTHTDDGVIVMATTIVNGWKFTESSSKRERSICLKLPNDYMLLMHQGFEGTKHKFGRVEDDTWEVNISSPNKGETEQYKFCTQDEVVELAENTAKLAKE